MLLATCLLFALIDLSQQFNACFNNNPCKNGAKCLPMPSSNNLCPVTCICASTQFTGLYCEKINSLIIGHLNPIIYPIQHHALSNACPFNCLNGGMCSTITLKCICLNGWSGMTCEKKETIVIINNDDTSNYALDNNHRPNPCDSNPCKHNGKCITSSFYTYRCVCKHNWIGITCERQREEPILIIMPTTSTPTTTTTTTTTLKSYPSIIIERKIINVCFINPCRNGGSCISYTFNSYKCNCLQGWSGNACEKRSHLIQVSSHTHDEIHPLSIQLNNNVRRQTCNNNPCQHGGQCKTSLFYGYTCVCTSGWTGLACDRHSERIIHVNDNVYDNSENDNESNNYYIKHELQHQEKSVCVHNPCRNGGSCIQQPQGIYGYTCLCPLHTSGFLCERYY